MSTMKNTRLITLIAALLLLVAAESAMAQSTIFNIPTTDVVAKGKVYFEFDYLPQIPKPEGADRLQIIDPRIVVGPGGNVEVGSNFASFHISGTTNAFFQPNIKWRFASDDNKGLAAAGGGILFAPINHREGVDTFGLVYGNFSKKVKTGNYGPRFTAGPYGIVSGGSGWVGPKAGVILGYEQPVHARASIVADWFSGQNAFGYFTPGVSLTLPANGLLSIGYSLGNDSFSGNDNRFLFVYYGVTF
jgi:hypothetical protein